MLFSPQPQALNVRRNCLTLNYEMKKLDIALVDEMTSEKLQEMTSDGMEIALDSFLSDGIIKDIPFFGTLYKSSKAAIGIKDAIFAKMVYKFLFELKDIPPEKRKSFIEKLQTKEGYDKKVGETLIVILDKLDDLDKPTLIGRLLKYTIEEQISFEDFLRISAVIQKAFLPDLLFLKKNSFIDYYNPVVREQFMTLGLVRLELEFDTRESTIRKMSRLTDSPTKVSQKLKFELNNLGEKIRKFLLNCA